MVEEKTRQNKKSMLIPARDIASALRDHGITPRGILHVGAHHCEELDLYENELGVPRSKIVWLEGNPEIVFDLQQKKGDDNIPNIYHAVVSNRDDREVVFHVANNTQSSSILEMSTHAAMYPEIHYVKDLVCRTKTIDTFMEQEGLDPSAFNLWNFDIQGAELMALQGAVSSLSRVDALIIEINDSELYADCGLTTEIDAFLKRFGFIRLITMMTNRGWGDAFYIRKSS